MEIIHLILGKANPDRMNGVNKVVYQLATKQTNANKNVEVWGITSNLEHNYGKRNFKTVLFQAYKNPFKLDVNLKKALLRLPKQSVIHLHGGWVPTYASLTRFLVKNSISYVLTPHGAYNTIAMQRSGFVKKLYFLFLERFIIKNALQVHSLGESEIEGLKKLYPSANSFLLPYGFEFQQHAITPTSKEKFILGFVGRIDIYTKGLDVLISAFSKFNTKFPNSELWIIGDGEDKTKLENTISEHNKQASIKCLGSKFGKEKDELIKKMSYFVHSSRNEGLPTSVIEALNFGVPSIVTFATNMASYITRWNCGISIDNESSIALENAIEQAYTTFIHMNEAYNEQQINAQLLVQNEFDWNKIVDKFDLLYLA
jgi:glycosyltransferase involved in cell wall biosynthesis